MSNRFCGALAALAAISVVSCSGAVAADLGAGPPPPTLTACTGVIDPYKNYNCLDTYLGDNPFMRLFNYYKLEWGHDGPPVDPNAPPSRRGPDQIAAAPQTTPPYPFTDWPFGASDGVAIATPNAVDSPLMQAVHVTPLGKPMEDAHIQVYGWVNVGGNISTAKTGYGGNAPVAYAYTPDIVQLDQAVVYIERVPDTVQQDNVDWGFRLAPIYGENYRYTTALGAFSNQYVYDNHYEGFDMPMAYGEVYIPKIAEGMTIRIGRYISIPDIEAQLAPNNYMYTHSITYTFDNYTNTGIVSSTRINKNWMVQFGLSSGTETFPWNTKWISLPNGYSGQRDPGAQPTVTACVQWQSDNDWDSIYPCINGINNGEWGYNNLQWFGGTIYHKFTDKFHVSIESYYEFERNVNNSPVANPSATGYAGTPWQYMANPPTMAQCGPTLNVCPMAKEWGLLAYWNYEVTPLDNISLRTEFYNDENGQRTGYATRYTDVGLGWQHWFSPQVEIRPEVTWYRSWDEAAFDNGTTHKLWFAGGDIIWHF